MAQPQPNAPTQGPQRYTYADYQSWNDGQRWELLDGLAIAMSPAPVVDHQVVVGAVFAQLFMALAGKPCRPLLAPLDVLLPLSAEADDAVTTTVQPDVMIVCDPSKIQRKGVRGAPDFVLEVTSPGHATHDHIRKRRRYELAGVREYWIVQPSDRVLWAYLLQDGKFGPPAVEELLGPRPLGILPEVVVQWDEVVALLGPVED